MIEGMEAIVKGVPIEVEAGIYSDWGKTPYRLQMAWEALSKLPDNSLAKDAILAELHWTEITTPPSTSSAWLVNSLYSGPGRPFGR